MKKLLALILLFSGSVAHAQLTMTVDTALTEVPVNIFPLTDDGDFKSVEGAVAYNAGGLALYWHFVSTTGATSVTAVTPTTSGDYDWSEGGTDTTAGMYYIEIPASGGASINNDTEGYGWFTGVATGVLPWRGPVIAFVPANVSNSLVNGSDKIQTDVNELAGITLDSDAGNNFAGFWNNDDSVIGLEFDDLANISTTLNSGGTIYNFVDGLQTDSTAIKGKTDSLTFTTAGRVDSSPRDLDGDTTALDNLVAGLLDTDINREFYVDDDAAGSADGSSLTDAFTTLSAANAACNGGLFYTVYVAAGSYDENFVASNPNVTWHFADNADVVPTTGAAFNITANNVRLINPQGDSGDNTASTTGAVTGLVIRGGVIAEAFTLSSAVQPDAQDYTANSVYYPYADKDPSILLAAPVTGYDDDDETVGQAINHAFEIVGDVNEVRTDTETGVAIADGHLTSAKFGTTAMSTQTQFGTSAAAFGGATSVFGNITATAQTNLNTVFNTDFATNYDATNDRWLVAVNGFLGTDITETNAGDVAESFAFFFDVDPVTTKTVDDVGVAGSGLTKADIRAALFTDAFDITTTSDGSAMGSILDSDTDASFDWDRANQAIDIAFTIFSAGASAAGNGYNIVSSATHGNAALKTLIDDMQTDVDGLATTLGAAGAGLTAIPWNAAWDAETQSESADAITAYFGTAGSSLTGIPWNASWDAEVQSEVDDGLTAQGVLKLDTTYQPTNAAGDSTGLQFKFTTP